MKRHIPIDGAGRVVLPKAVRDQFHLSAGDLLEVSSSGDEIKLHPVWAGGKMVKEGSFRVYDSGAPIDPKEVDEFAKSLRSSQDSKIARGTD